MSGTVYTLRFDEIGKGDHGRVGGKCASLGEMTRAGVAVPPGFAHVFDLGFVQMGQLVLFRLGTKAEFVDVVDGLAES